MISTWRAIALMALGLLWSGIAPATEPAPYYTKTYHMTAPCDGNDFVYRVAIHGYPPMETWQLRPWEDDAIAIQFVQLVKIAGGPHGWLMAGNNAVGDTMVFLPSDRVESSHSFPPGTAKVLPGRPGAADGHYLDLHGHCTGADISVFYVVGYTVLKPR